MIHRQCEYAQSLALLLDYLYLYILFNSVSFLVKFTLVAIISLFDKWNLRTNTGDYLQVLSDLLLSCSFFHILHVLCSFDAPPHHPSLWVWVGPGRWWHCERGSCDKGCEDQRKSPGGKGVQHKLTTDYHRGTAASSLTSPRLTKYYEINYAVLSFFLFLLHLHFDLFHGCQLYMTRWSYYFNEEQRQKSISEKYSAPVPPVCASVLCVFGDLNLNFSHSLNHIMMSILHHIRCTEVAIYNNSQFTSPYTLILKV